jgi:hypothetical protein
MRGRNFLALKAEELVRGGMQADLLVGKNLLAQVPDLRSFDLPYIFANFAPRFPEKQRRNRRRGRALSTQGQVRPPR